MLSSTNPNYVRKYLHIYIHSTKKQLTILRNDYFLEKGKKLQTYKHTFTFIVLLTVII